MRGEQQPGGCQHVDLWRACLIWFSVITAILGGIRFSTSVPHFDQDSLSTYIDAGLAASVQEDFRVTGTSHIIAISG